ncbi:MAG: WXG100 family type VII secretion target [Saccharofermentans sp.]|nr:WXG100 family type VII secretion target [Saccharofermentans sp.]
MENRELSVNYGLIEDYATRIDSNNKQLLAKLEEIQRTINDLAGSWESDSAESIRGKITGMQPRFEEYSTIINNYVVLLRNMVSEYRSTESVNKTKADSFI